VGRPVIRKVRWTDLPLGAVVVEGPPLFHAMIPELAGYPVITERLRAELFRRYQLGAQAAVTIVDPSYEIEPIDFRLLDQEARRLVGGLAPLVDLKKRSRQGLLTRPDARAGLSTVSRWEEGPYTLVKSWARSVSSVIRDPSDFGSALWGDRGPATVGDAVGGLLTGRLPSPSRNPTAIDLGVDVSYSMTVTGKADLALEELTQVVGPLVGRWGASDWRVWAFAETAVRDTERRPPGTETRLAPFLRRVLDSHRDGTAHLCVVITDGRCQDAPEALRLLERLADRGIDYLQLILLDDDDGRQYTVGSDQGRDDVVTDETLKEGQEVLTRTDAEWEAFQTEALAQVTDLAEAAHGAQVVLTWTPVFRVVTLDVYERFVSASLVPGTTTPEFPGRTEPPKFRRPSAWP
jgi:hypothetical protein